ncbi:RHS repeat-associated core domain-containing protein [Salana multivorans]
MTDAMGNAWSWGFDLRGRQVTRTDPDTGTTTSTYDAVDQLLTSTDARGVTLATVYDQAGRRTQLRQGSASGTLLSSWTWDTVAKGQISSSTRFEGSSQYVTAVTAYDDGYRPLGQAVTIPAAEGSLAGTYTIEHTYTLDGQRRSTKYPKAGGLNAETVTTFYDGRGVAEWMGGGVGWGTYVAGTQYSVYGEILVADLGAIYSSMVNYSYEHGTRRLSQTWLQRETGSAYDIDLAYSYDHAGNVTRIGDGSAAGDVQCFGYDDQRRLSRAWTPSSGDCGSAPSVSALGGPAPYWQSYTYDAVGNRTGTTSHSSAGSRVTSYTRPSAGSVGAHRVTSTSTSGAGGPASSSSFSYDAAGNTVSRQVGSGPVESLTWDVEGRLDTLVQGAVTHDYTYTADGQRLVRREGTTTTVYLPGGMELSRTGASGVVTGARYYSFGGETVAVRTGAGAAGVSSLVSDHHDTPGIAVNNATDAITRRYHDPFGNPRGGVPVWVGDHGFLDKPTDTTGLTQIGARYYDPVLGAFISPDPILDTATPQQWGPYAYSENNPTTYSDPTGLISNIVMHDGSLGRGRKATTAPTASVGKRQSLQTLLGPPGPTKAPPVITRTKPGLVPAPEPRDTGRVIAGIGHGILEGLGLIPGAGEFFDLGNAIWYGVERDTENVLWSAASAIPIAGMIVPPGKWIAKAIKTGDSAAPPRFVTTAAGTTIDRLSISAKVSAQRQARHVVGTPQYRGGSYFTSADDAQAVLDAFHSGAADLLGTTGPHVVVRYPQVTGFNNNRGAGYLDQPTDVFFIKGTSSPSVVPYNPNWTP